MRAPVCVCIGEEEEEERECVCLCVSVIQNVCVCLRVCEVTGCSSRITATKAKKDVDQEVLLYSFLAAVLKHG